MKNIYALQLSDFFPSATLPQALGSLLGYIFQSAAVRENFSIVRTFWENETSDQVLSEISSPDVLLCSCYVWNWNRTYQVIKTIRRNYPECLIIIGGPEPEYSQRWINNHPEVDLLIPYYGEEALDRILIQSMKNCSFKNIPGIITQNFSNTGYLPPDFKKIASPYLNGYFDKLLKNKKKETTFVRSVFESNRGCPFSCTFCDIGAKQYNRINIFDIHTSFKELEWIVKNGIDTVDVADANFGILPRDEDIIDELIRLKNTLGWHGRFLPTWSKKKADRVLRIAKKIIKNKLDSVFGLSLQSLTPRVLKNIKRQNAFNLKDLDQIVGELNGDGVSIYTELIFPLPGETLSSFKDSIHKVLDMKYVFDKFQINQLSRYNNAQIASLEEAKKYQIEWAEICGFTRHYYGNNSTDIVAISTKDISKDEVFEGLFYSKCFIIPLYFYGVTRLFVDDMYKYFDISRSKFFIELYSKIQSEKWFSDFKESQKKHYFNAIEGNKQFGQILTNDPLDYFPEFSISHQFYLESQLFDFLFRNYPNFSDLIQFSQSSIWKNKFDEHVLHLTLPFKSGKWLFSDDRKMKKEEYFKELYVSGRFDQRWKKKTIKRVNIC